MSAQSKNPFRSLRSFNYRLWIGGSLVSNVGTWMQRIAQDWLVLTQLTHHNATSVGVVMALQSGPSLLLLPLTGYVADHWDRRRLLMITQACLGLSALGLGIVTVVGVVRLWHVFGFALFFGCVSAFDNTARQTFGAELVGEADLANAVALNSTSFNVARLIGPAVAGLVIAAVGSGWAFLINAGSFAAVLCSLGLMRRQHLHTTPKPKRSRGGLMAGYHYVRQRRDLRTVMLMIFLIGTFGLNFPIFISTMAVTVFHVGARQYGLLMSIMAVGSLAGALLTTRHSQPTLARLLIASAVFGLGFTLAALSPNYALFALTLVLIGVSAVTFTSSTSSFTQLATEPAMRGRVVAIRLALALGGTPIGAPIVGWVADRFGPRWGAGVAALSGFIAALVALIYLVRYRGLRPTLENGRFRFIMSDHMAKADTPAQGAG